MTTILRHYLYLDLGFYAACNLKCTYCRKDVVRDDHVFQLADLVTQVDAFLSRFRAGVVKLSGYGEITMWRHFPEALALLQSTFPMVQVISNGTFSRKTADLLLQYDNVSPNLTIDGHSMGMNELRVQGNGRTHQAMHDNLRYMVASGRRVEVNCVLHGYNASGFEEYCKYLYQFGPGKVMLFPFPVKSFSLAQAAAAKVRVGIETLIESIDRIWETYAGILPPRLYGERLKTFLIEGGRYSTACHVHWANLGSGSRNERLHCPNYGEELSYGPMTDALTRNADAIRVEELRHLDHGHVGPACTSCFNHFHIINFFLEGQLSLEELLTVPSLQADGVAEVAMAMKMEFDNSYRPAPSRGNIDR